MICEPWICPLRLNDTENRAVFGKRFLLDSFTINEFSVTDLIGITGNMAGSKSPKYMDLNLEQGAI